MTISNKMMYGHEFNCSDTQLFQIIYGNRMSQRSITAAYLFWNTGVQLCKPSYMSFINDRFMIRNVWTTIVTPIKFWIDYYRFWNIRCTINIAEAKVFVR